MIYIKIKKLFKNVLLKFTNIILVLLIIEGVVRLISPQMYLPYGYISRGIEGESVMQREDEFIYNKDLFWRWNPRAQFRDINSLGLREKEFSIVKSKDVIRIIFMGDDVITGWPVISRENSCPKVLENLLNTHISGYKFEVINAGVPGYSSYQGLKWFKEEIVKYHPDIVIIYYGINDSLPTDIPDKDVRIFNLLSDNFLNYFRHFELYQLFLEIFLHFKYPPFVEYTYRNTRVSSEDYLRNLKEIDRIGRNNNIKVIFITPPIWYNRINKVIFTREGYRINNRDLEVVDIYELFKAKEKEAGNLFLKIKEFYPNDFLLNEEGHKIIGEEIFQQLLKIYFTL